jgi:cytidyltransferase-like protein
MDERIIVISGYFDPLHWGHIEYMRQAKALGTKLVVIVNNDRQSVLKKGMFCMPAAERVKIIRELKCVDLVVESIDEDRTVCRTLAMLHPHVFANGGDQFNSSIPEAAICKQLGIELVDGLGAKVQSSRWILSSLQKKLSDSKAIDYLAQ